MLGNKDSLNFKKDYPAGLNAFIDNMDDVFEVKSYSFSNKLEDSLKQDFSGKETDISAAINEICNIYENRNVGAIILATDGIFNKGVSPLYAANTLKAPIYAIALGDTTIKRDLVIPKVEHNQMAYLNNTFPVEVSVQARKLNGKKSSLSISHNGKTIETKAIEITGDNFFKSFSFQLKAEKPGIQRYSILLNPVEGEFTKSNNQQDIFIEVLDSRQKILILAAAPDPDIAAIRLSLQQNENYEVETALADDFSGSIKPYSLVFLHQLPSGANRMDKILSEMQSAGVPAFFIVGKSSSFEALNRIQDLIQFSGSRNMINEAIPSFNRNFGLFTVSDELQKAFQSFDPLQAPYANYSVSKSTSTMFSQKIGTVETGYPLLVFNSDGQKKNGILIGTGIWQWRMHDFGENQNHDRFDELISKIVQFLSVREEKKKFRIVSRNAFLENEQVTLEAEVYNASYELINTPDVAMNIYDDKNSKYPFTFSKAGNAYRLNAGQFSPGDYRYEASVNISGKLYTAAGKFIVKPVVAEFINSTADHGVLQTLANRNGGKMFYPNQLKTLEDMLKARKDLKPVSHSEIRLKEIIQVKWIFFMLLFLLGIEWFMRKRNGSY